MAILQDEFEYFTAELLKTPAQPYHFANEPLADQYFTAFKAEHGAATYFKGDGGQWICLDSRARKRLAKQLRESHKRQKEALERLETLIAEVEKGA